MAVELFGVKINEIMDIEKIVKVLSEISREVFPSYSYCKRCGFTWNLVESRSVNTSHRIGCFAVCVECWEESNIDELIGYYTQLYNSWNEKGAYKFDLDHLLKCVRAEKEGNPIYD